jgi:hypothetical protein
MPVVVNWVYQTALMNTTSADTVPSVGVDSAGNVYVAYQSLGTVSGGTMMDATSNICIFKMDANGAMIWIKETVLMNTSLGDTSPKIAVDISGNLYISYRSLGTVSGGTRTEGGGATNDGYYNICVFKMDTNGAMIWIKETRLMNTNLDDVVPTIAVDLSGNIYVSYQTAGTVSGGTRMDSSTEDNICVFKMDTNGAMIWIKETRLMNTSSDEGAPTPVVDISGNLYISYQSLGTVSGGTKMDNAGFTNIIVFKLDTNGAMVWIKETALMNTNNNDQAPTVAVDTNGNVYVSYHTLGTVSGGTRMDSGFNNICVFKMDTNGAMVWIKETSLMNTDNNDQAPTVAIDSTGNVYVSYQTLGTVSGGTRLDAGATYNICVFKMDTNGAMIWIQETSLMNTPANDTVPAIVVIQDGAIYIAYQTAGAVSGGTQSGTTDIVVFKMLQTPDAPTTVTATAGYLQAVVSFTAPPTTEIPIVGYTATSSPGNFTGTIVSATAQPITVTGLTAGTPYTFTATAYNSLGTSIASTASAAVTPYTLPGVPTALSVNITGTQAVVTFTAPVSDGSSTITGYTVTSSPAGPTGGGVGTSSPITMSNLTPGITYTFTVAAVNAAGTGAASMQVLYAPYLSWITQTALMNTSSDETVPSVGVDSAGNVYVAYQTAGTVSGGTRLDAGATNNICVFKMDTSGAMVWIKETVLMNTTLDDTAPSVAVDSTGNIYVSYQTTGTVSGGTMMDALSNICVFKMDTNGAMVWIKETALMNTTSGDFNPKITVDSTGNLYISYQTAGTVSGGTMMDALPNICVFKMNTNGAMVWIKETALMNTTLDDTVPSVAVDSTGNVYISYQTLGTVSGGTMMDALSNICVFKMDTNGAMVWIKETSLMNTSDTDLYPKIAVDSLGNLYVSYQSLGTVSGGTRLDAGATNNICVFKLDANGAMIWIQETALMNTTLDDTAPSIAVDSVGNVYVSYQTPGTVSGEGVQGGSDIVMFKLNTIGTMVWIKESVNVNTLADDTVSAIVLSQTGGVYVSYQTAGAVNGWTQSGGTDIVVFKMLQIPDAPTAVTATAGYLQAVVSFTAPPTTEVPIIGYTATSSPSSFTGTIVSATAQPITVTGLAAGTPYTFTVTAYNSLGTSIASTASAAVTPYTLPGAPTAVSANVVNVATQAIVAFTAPVSNGGSAITNYTVASSPVGLTGSGASSPITVTGLVSETVYRFTVTAYNAAGAGSPSTLSSQVMYAAYLDWIKQTSLMNTTVSDTAPSVAVDSSGNVYVAYQTNGTVSGGTRMDATYNICIFKMDANGAMTWIKETVLMNTSLGDTSPKIAVDLSGNLYISYQSLGTVSGGTRTEGAGATNNGYNNICVFKMDTNGAMIWIKETRLMNTISDDVAPTIAVDISGNIYVSYQTLGTVSGGTMMDILSNICVFKMDTNGAMVWIKETRLMSTTLDDTAPTIAVDISGNLYISYQSLGTVSGGTRTEATGAAGNSYNNICVFKMDTNGAMIWIKETRLMNTNLNVVPTIAVDLSGNIYISYQSLGTVSGGTKMDSSTDDNICVFKMDTNGAMIWIKETRLMNTTLNDINPAIAVDSFGNVYVSYQTLGTVSGGVFLGGVGDIVMFKMDANGAMVWIRESVAVNTSANDTVPAITVSQIGVIYVSYQTTGAVNGATSAGSNDIVVFKLLQPPGAPTAPAATVSGISGQAIVSWTASTYTGGSTTTGYTVTSSPGSITAASTGALTAVVVGLTNGVSYTFTVTATNTAGTGDASTATSSVTPYAIPDIMNVQWVAQQALMNTIGDDVSPTIASDSAGNIYVSYQTTGTVSGGTFMGVSDICVFKMNPSGVVQWIKEQAVMNTLVDDQYPRIAVDPSGNVYVTYYTGGTVSGGTFLGGVYDVAAFKMDSNGAVQWINELALMNTTGADYNPAITVDSTGNVYISYNTTGTVSGGVFSGGADICVLKMNTGGVVQWIKEQAVMNTNGFDYNPSIAVDLTGNVYVSYYTGGTVSGGVLSGSNDIVVFKMDSSGVVQWIQESTIVNTSASDTAPSIAVDSGGNSYVAYSSTGTVSGGTFIGTFDIVVFKLNTSGVVQWVRQQQVMNTTASDTVPTIAVDLVGSTYVSYQTAGTVSNGTFIGVYDIVVFKMNTLGQVLWIKELAVTNTILNDTSPSITVDLSGLIYVTYQTTGAVFGGTNIGGSDVVVFKLAQAPDPPTGVSAVAGINQAIVSFTAPVITGGYNITTYTVTPSSGTAVTGSASPITVTGLTNGVAYTFTVQATNAVGISGASSASAPVTPTPPAPTNLTASSPSVNTVFVQWDAAIGATSTTQYVVTILPIRSTVTVLNNVTQVTITGLPSRIYTFTVRSEDSGIVSATSAETTPVIVMGDTSQYKFMLFNAPCKFKVFSAFQII